MNNCKLSEFAKQFFRIHRMCWRDKHFYFIVQFDEGWPYWLITTTPTLKIVREKVVLSLKLF